MVALLGTLYRLCWFMWLLGIGQGNTYAIKAVYETPKYYRVYDTAGKTLVRVSLEDGAVKLYGKPNKAAEAFWKAVSNEYRGLK